MKNRVVVITIFICLFLSGCGTSYYLRKADQIDQMYASGQITYEQRQAMYYDLIAQAEAQQTSQNILGAIGRGMQALGNNLQSQDSGYVYPNQFGNAQQQQLYYQKEQAEAQKKQAEELEKQTRAIRGY